jgi:hypothetical protein
MWSNNYSTSSSAKWCFMEHFKAILTSVRNIQWLFIQMYVVCIQLNIWYLQFCFISTTITHARYIVITRQVSLVEQELLPIPVHLSSPPVFSGVRDTRSLILCVCFVDRCLSFFSWPLCCLFFDIRILITPLVSLIHVQFYFITCLNDFNFLIWVLWFQLTFPLVILL